MFSLSWERDGVKGISVKAWSCSLVFQAPNPSAHILLRGVTRHKTFGRAMVPGMDLALQLPKGKKSQLWLQLE